MGLRDRYDWVVLGDHPGALLSASLAAKLGLSVLVLPLVPGLKRLISTSGQCLDPEPNFLLGAGKRERIKGLTLGCLDDLGIMVSEEDCFAGPEALPQVITPVHRLRFSLEDESMKREFKHELGETVLPSLGLFEALAHAEFPFLSFWQSLPRRLTLPEPKRRHFEEPVRISDLKLRLAQTGMSLGVGAQNWLNEDFTVFKLDHFLRREGTVGFAEIALGLWFGVVGIEKPDLRLSELLHVMALGRAGACYRGGLSAYRTFLLNLAKRLGVEVRNKEECKRIFVDAGRLRGVQVSHSQGAQGKMISVEGGVLGCSLAQASFFMSESGRNWFHKKKKSVLPKAWRFTLALTVLKEAIPPGMSQRAIWQEEGAPALEIELANPLDYSIPEPQNRFIFIRTCLPYSAESLKPSYQRQVASRMLRQLTEIFPFVENHLIRVFPDFRSENLDFSEAFGFVSLDMIPENLLCFWGNGLGSQSGVDGLFLASGESFPEMGTLGGVVAAVEAVAGLAHRLGLKGPLA